MPTARAGAGGAGIGGGGGGTIPAGTPIGAGGSTHGGATGQPAQTGIGGITCVGTTTMTVAAPGSFTRWPAVQGQHEQAPHVAAQQALPLPQSLPLQLPSHLQPSLQHLQPPSHLQPSLHVQFRTSKWRSLIVTVPHFASLQQPVHPVLACSQHSSAMV
jgi:hypothetical protein